MGIQSSINNLLSQAQSLAAFYKGFDKVEDIIKGQEATKNESQIQTEIAAGNAPMKDGKVVPEWIQKQRDEYANKIAFNSDGSLTGYGREQARILENRLKKGLKIDRVDEKYYNNPSVQEYIKSFNDKNARFESALNTLESSISPELKNKVAGIVARGSVEARTNSINKAKSNFDEHTASLIRYYGKGSGNP